MASKITPSGEYALRAIEQFPESPTRTIARFLHETYPELFLSIESARSLIRKYRGNNGKKNRETTANKKYYMPPGDDRRNWTKIPRGHSTPWKPHQIGAGRYLVIGDVHIPYQDANALEIALIHAANENVTGCIILGDYFDFYKLSRFVKDPTARNVQDEIETGHTIWSCIRERLGTIPIIMKIGNHDERYTHYLYRRAPELCGIGAFKLDRVIEAEKNDVTIVPSEQIIMAGKLPCIHGHEYMRGMTNPVNAARGYFLRAKSDVLGAHYHQPSSHNESDINGREITTWSIGCLCGLHPDYARLNKWGHGFALLDITESGAYDVLNKRIQRDGTVRAA